MYIFFLQWSAQAASSRPVSRQDMLFSPRPVDTPARSLDEETTAGGVPKWVSLNYRAIAIATGNLNFIKATYFFHIPLHMRQEFCLKLSTRKSD